MPSPTDDLTTRRVFASWWPLAASWLLMGLELPLVSATMARLADPRIHLAAYGGVVFPVALIIEAPVIMMLAASTALSKDQASFHLMRRFMTRLSTSLTLLHVLVAFTPLYYLLARAVLGVPEDIVEPARIGLMIMTPWTWAIAYRRFHQGVLIRFGRARLVGTGTLVRLAANIVVLGAGLAIGSLPGIVVGAAAVAAGVMAEAAFVGIMVRPVVRGELRDAPPVEPHLTLGSFLRFYIPLAMTSLLLLIAMPIGSASMSRMPEPLDSLAVWPVLSGLVFTLRSVGFAFNEVVVALLDEPGALRALRRFAVTLAAVMTGLLAVVAATPLGRFWLNDVTALPERLTALGLVGIWLSIPLPAFSVVQSLFQGILVHSRRTRGITQAVVAYLVVNGIVLFAGVVTGRVVALYVAVAAMVIASLAMTAWLWRRANQAIHYPVPTMKTTC